VHLELVDVLRCPRPHAPSVLIASIDRISGRSVDRGTLACPVCDARFGIVDGGVVFDRRHFVEHRAERTIVAAAADRVTRAAALLGLAEPGGLVLLGGDSADVAAGLHDIADVSVILHNPPGPVVGWDAVTPIYGERVPLASGVVRGAMVDARVADAVVDVVRALRPAGRLVAPADFPVPEGVRELARDADEWVGERTLDTASDPVPLRRADRSQPSE
jgi:hypothetical protein